MTHASRLKHSLSEANVDIELAQAGLKYWNPAPGSNVGLGLGS